MRPHEPADTLTGGFADVDQVTVLYTRVRALIEPSFTVLDIGCGRGKQSRRPRLHQCRLKTLIDACDRLIGIDLDPAGSENPCIDEFRMMRPHEAWHVEDASIDLALSDYVLEHVDDPRLFFSDCRRVIRSGGLLCMRTTNVFSYFGLASSSGFDHCVYGCQSDPAHYGFSRMLYALEVFHQRLVPAAIKPAIFAFAVRGD